MAAFATRTGIILPKQTVKPPIPDDLNACKQIIEQLFERLDEKESRIDDLMQQVQLLLRARYGRKAETFNLDQLRLFRSEPEAAPAPADQPQPPVVEAVPVSGKAGHGRRKPASELPRIRVEYHLDDTELSCPECGNCREKIGEEGSEQDDWVPASVTVVEHARFKYSCRKCQGHVAVAEGAEKPVEKGLAAPRVFSYVATSKFPAPLPLHRLESIFKRQGASISRSTMCDWIDPAAAILPPIYERVTRQELRARLCLS